MSIILKFLKLIQMLLEITLVQILYYDILLRLLCKKQILKEMTVWWISKNNEVFKLRHTNSADYDDKYFGGVQFVHIQCYC